MIFSKEIRKAFLDFFVEKKHKIVSSSPMVVKNDPTLMFANAGMNQFKDIFLGNQPAKSKRVADTQKCLRVSGKHNDLEEVGLDTYHHTMFEMLGNWSFGDYFKEEAIDWAWEFLVEKLDISKDRIYATVFEGSKEDNLQRDNEASKFWGKYLSKECIINGNKKDNFWEMGETGPCGPCSEIHIDIRDENERKNIPGYQLVNKDHPEVIEIWNLVFIQFNRRANGILEELPDRHVDTGMGFERLCMVIQGKKSNYDTDIFQNIISKISKQCNIRYGKNEKSDIAMRVIADHLRAVSFAIADGQLPSNNKAGYVIRRILRRAVRYGYTFLGFRKSFIFKLVEELKNTMGDTFPEIGAQQSLIEKVIKEEEEAFLRTLDNGIKLLDEKIKEAKKYQGKIIKGEDAFVLYDTFGFPLDLTELISRENGLEVDLEGFHKEMKKQKERARNDADLETDDWVEVRKIKQTKFIGYNNFEAEIKIGRYRKVVQKNRTLFHLVFDQTPFYAESGGQVGDTGILKGNLETIKIIDTQKENNLIIHITKNLPKDLKGTFTAIIDKEARRKTANNHTATHLLDYALRKVLGSHVEQKGSLVHPDYLRFDFSHYQKVTKEELDQIQMLVNNLIRQNLTQDEMNQVPFEEAKDMGAIALFGEKYGDEVRVIKFGDSVELCGGTHVPATGQIGQFMITSESAISAGVRRIEAITADKAEKQIQSDLELLKEIKLLFNNPKDLKIAIEGLINENNDLNKQIEDFEKKAVAELKENLKKNIEKKDNIQIIARRISLDSAQAVKDLAFQLKGEVDNLFLVLGTEIKGKPGITVMINEKILKERGLNAGQIVKEAGKEIKGGGGGQPFYATAGGSDITGLDKAIEKAKAFI